MTRLLCIISALAFATFSSCGSSSTCSTISTSGPWTIFPSADGGANTVVGAATGSVKSCTENGKSRVTLDVTLTSVDGGVSASRAYGAHVHVASCATGQGGGHYRNNPDAGASTSNEIWLDFTTSAAGVGAADTSAQWLIRPGEAKAVILHDHTTDATGAAGPKLVCIDVPF
jgi:hypothetical protein